MDEWIDNWGQFVCESVRMCVDYMLYVDMISGKVLENIVVLLF